ncbi:MAG: oligosaccharide flippase family protein [Clostridia bacterium]|nr:oligosaccharide flippase family protein [Clostridia bacterium]
MKNKQIKLGAIISYVAIFVNIAAMLIYTPWMIEQIGEESYGLYTLANSLIALFLVDFGLSSATSRFVAKYRAEGRQDKVDSFLGAVYKLYMAISAVIFVVLLVIYFLIDEIYVKLTPAEIEQFKVVYIISAAFAVINFPFVTFNGILNAYEKFIQLKIADLIYRVLLVGITIAALMMGYGLYALVSVHAIVGLIVIAYKFIVLKICTPVKANYKQSEKGIYKSIFSFSIWVTISSLAQRLVFNITPSVLGIVANSVAIAVFGIVSTIEGYTYTITSAINGMFMPKIARIYANKEGEQDINPLLLKVGRFQYGLNGLIIAGFAVVGLRFIDLWVGSDFRDAYVGTLLVLIPGLFFNSLQIANTAMIVQNKVKIQSFVNVGMGVVNVILSFVFSYFFGVIGACLSIFVAYMLRSIAFHIIYKKCLNMDMLAVIKQCYIKLSIPIIATVALGLIVNHFMPLGGWLGFLVVGCITVAIFAVLVLLVGFTGQEKKKLVGFLKNKIRRKAQ